MTLDVTVACALVGELKIANVYCEFVCNYSINTLQDGQVTAGFECNLTPFYRSTARSWLLLHSFFCCEGTLEMMSDSTSSDFRRRDNRCALPVLFESSMGVL